MFQARHPHLLSTELDGQLTMLPDLLVEQVVGGIHLLDDLVKDGELLLGLGLLLFEHGSVVSRVVAAERDTVLEVQADDELVAVREERAT